LNCGQKDTRETIFIDNLTGEAVGGVGPNAPAGRNDRCRWRPEIDVL
jgi:hypothetical protein